MIRRLDAATESFLTDLASTGRRRDRAQREVTSGRRVNSASDAPDQLSGLLQLRTELQQTQQIRSNLGRIQTEVDTAENMLSAGVDAIERASVLGQHGANGVTTTQQRQILAGEVESLLERMVGLADTRVETRYIFSGNADGQSPYSLDLSLPDPVSSYQGSAATRQVQHPMGTRISVSKTAEEIFDNADPNNNAFDALNNLRIALQNDDTTAVTSALGQLRSAGDHLNQMLAFYGTAQDKVAKAVDFAHKQELRLQTRISEIQDADMTASIVELNQARYQQQVALSAKAKMPPTSLFDFLR